MSLNHSNKTAMTKMETWTAAETPRIQSGHQSHRPITAGGASLSKKGGKNKRYDRDGIARKYRAVKFQAIAAKRAARRAAGSKK